MFYSQYLRIETRAGGCMATPRAFIRAARSLLGDYGRSRGMRNARHEFYRDGLKLLAEARQLYIDVKRGSWQ